MNTPTSLTNRRAFTLVELLTVIAVIAILAGILIPVVSSIRNSARSSTCASNLLFAADNKNRFPGQANPPSAFGRAWMTGGWEWVLSATMFETQSIRWAVPFNTSHYRDIMGSPKDALYCPASAVEGSTSARSYLMNEYTKAGTYGGFPANESPVSMSTDGVAWDWQPGAPLSRFSDLSRKVLFIESERTNSWALSYGGGSTPGFGAFQLDTTSAPWPVGSDTGTRYAFRHQNRMHTAFMDGHVESLAPDAVRTRINRAAAWDMN